jgi:hypothetical protein
MEVGMCLEEVEVGFSGARDDGTAEPARVADSEHVVISARVKQTGDVLT